jgi:hypothetical protein
MPSPTRRFRRSLGLGGVLLVALLGALEARGFPRTAYFGGRRLAEKWERLEAFERDGPADVLVVGASQIDQGLDARRFGEVAGLRAFNFGVSGTDTRFQSELLRQLLATGRRPRTVVWALLDSTLRRSDINRQYLAAPATRWFEAGGARALTLGRHLPQFQRRRLDGWHAELTGAGLEPLDDHGRLQLASARRAVRAAPPELEGKPTSAPSDADDDSNERNAPELDAEIAEAREHTAETLRRLRAAGVSVWLVFTPFEAPSFARGSVHAWRTLTRSREGHYEWLVELAREHGLELVDLHACPGISEAPALFYDETHLNAAGSERLGALLGELLGGRRPLPEEWRGVPSRAHLAAIFGHEPPQRVAALEVGERVRLAERPELFPLGARTDLYAEVALSAPGAYRLELVPDATRARASGCYARVGDGPMRLMRAGRAPAPTPWRLARGVQRLELHAVAGELAWSELALVPVTDDAAR